MKGNEQPHNQYRIERVQRFGLNTLLNVQSTMGQRIASKPSGQLRSPESVDMLCASVRGRGRADSRASARLHRTRDEEKEGWRTVAPREAVKMSRLVHPAGISSQRHAREEYSSLSPFHLLSLCFSLLSLCVTIAGHRSAIASTRCLVTRENESLPLLRTSRGFSLKSSGLIGSYVWLDLEF